MADWLAALGPEGRDLLLSAEPSFLLAAFAGIEQQYGSVEEFAKQALNVPGEAIEKLRDHLIEP
jgi:protein tyrosine/serine phosphatase